MIARIKKLGTQVVPPIYRSLVREKHSKLTGGNLSRALSADYHVLSYPKSGRTWLRVMLGDLIGTHFGLGDQWDPVELNDRSGQSAHPTIRFSHDGDPHLVHARRIEKTKFRYWSKNVLLLVRDPRDVVVSMYFQRHHREKIFSGSIDEFVRSPIGGIDSIINYLNCWQENRRIPRTTAIVRYENLLDNGVRELLRVANFLGMTPAETVVADVVERFAFERMQKMERTGTLKGPRFSKTTDPNALKVRKGVAGGYREYLVGDTLDYVEERLQALHPFWQY